MPWLMPAVVATLAATLVLALVYLHLYAVERERHLRIMAAAWFAYALRFAFTLVIVTGRASPWHLLGEQLAVYLSGILLAWGLAVMAGSPVPRALVVLAAAGLVWIPAGVGLRLPTIWATLPTFTLLAALYVCAGWVFLRAARPASISHRVVGWSFVIWGLHKADYPFLRDAPWFAPWGFGIAACLEVAIAIGVIMISLYETRQRLAAFQRELELMVAARTEELRARCEHSEALAAELQRANRDLEGFSFTVAHDLRAPLRSITSFSQLLASDQAGRLDAEGRETLARIVAAGKRMSTLMDDLLAYARLGREEIELASTDLAELVASVRSEVTAAAPPGTVVSAPGPFPQVLAARPILHLALANLVANALKFHRPGEPPRVGISAATLGSRVRIRVADDGIGIPAGQQEKIFGLFERLHRAEEYPGTGIGLAIVRRAAERLGGRAGVESAPGLGSTFWIEVPAALPAELPVAATAAH